MTLRGIFAPLPAAVAAIALAGCFTPASRPPPPVEAPPPPVQPPVAKTPGDLVPRTEPRSRSGNPPFYEVFGKRYYVLASSANYLERGVASWYGPGFHRVRTSTGEIYDMYGMTAAHKTLPLPAYVRVTNLQNGRSVVVRVNDRGPFVGNRLIDLSYTAASRLDMLRNGTAMVEVRALEADEPVAPAAGAPAVAKPPAAVPAALYVQAGAFADPLNAERLVTKLRGGSYGAVAVRTDLVGGRTMYRVRIGPVADVPAFDRIVAALERAGVHGAHLATD
ncbi:MAG: septal ring lytic transglycosylase RlpA family protein [Steroidobacteraceae bacterium]